MPHDDTDQNLSIFCKIKRGLLGSPRELEDRSIFHKLSLISLLAWIGLGADGLSSSSYGPEEAFRALSGHTYLAILLAPATALTVFIISYAYSKIIEYFPHGGGGYNVASLMLGEKAGLVSGAALLVDYVLTITVSIVACTDALFSFCPLEWQSYKLAFAIFLIIFLILLNLRGVKESITILAPIFLTFLFTHVLLLGYGIFSHLGRLPGFVGEFQLQWSQDVPRLGYLGIFGLVMYAYTLGAGTYTGIEAVSNNLQIMREPRVQTGKRTMALMAVSLAAVVVGLFLCYELWQVVPTQGKTLNTVLAEEVFKGWHPGPGLALVTILSEGALLLVAAQAGFLGGPRVMANMAVDYWLPQRFAALSERLAMHNGIVLMGGTAILLVIYTQASISALVVMYAINVFVTFSLSQLGMCRFFIRRRRVDKKWKQLLLLHLAGFIMCFGILIFMVLEKFMEGAWVTILITSLLVGCCLLIKRHYAAIQGRMADLDQVLGTVVFTAPENREPLNPHDRTAVQLVRGFSAFGIHTLLSIIRTFPNDFKNIIFVAVAVVDSSTFKGPGAIEDLQDNLQKDLQKYVDLARKLGLAADYRLEVGTEVVETATRMCEAIKQEYPDSLVFAGQITFQLDTFYHRLLHNENAFAIQRRLQASGITTVILPISL